MSAKVCAESAVAHYLRRENDPQTFAAKRANVALAIQTSRFVVVPPGLMRPRTPAQRKAEKVIAWKADMRLAKAAAGQCRELLARPVANADQIRLDSQAESERAEKGELLRNSFAEQHR